MDLKLVNQLIALDVRKKKLKLEQADLAKDRQKLEADLKEQFDDGAKSVTTLEGTVYLRRDVYVSLVDRDVERSKEYLRSLELGEYIKETVNSQSLSAWYREREEANEVPPDFEEHVKVSETYSVRTTS
jgi:hypothetical protein